MPAFDVVCFSIDDNIVCVDCMRIKNIPLNNSIIPNPIYAYQISNRQIIVYYFLDKILLHTYVRSHG